MDDLNDWDDWDEHSIEDDVDLTAALATDEPLTLGERLALDAWATGRLATRDLLPVLQTVGGLYMAGAEPLWVKYGDDAGAIAEAQALLDRRHQNERGSMSDRLCSWIGLLLVNELRRRSDFGAPALFGMQAAEAFALGGTC